jgi:hypothetical protein
MVPRVSAFGYAAAMAVRGHRVAEACFAEGDTKQQTSHTASLASRPGQAHTHGALIEISIREIPVQDHL